MTAPRRPIADRLRNAAAALIVPRPGRRQTFVSRLLIRTSGAPREWLSEPWKKSIENRLLLNWLSEVQGVPVTDGRVAADPPVHDAEICPEAVIWKDQATGATLILARGATVIAGGVDRLITKFVENPDAQIAYGDAIYTGPDGRAAGHWLKASRTDPLLVAQGLLLHGLVALARGTPELDALLNALRGGSAFQTAFASFAADLALPAIVHCAAPVVICPPPQPLAVALPAMPDELPVVSVLIPTRNGWDTLGPCLASLRETEWPRDRLEIVVMDNGSDDPFILKELDRLARAGDITLLRDDGDFNFARLNNSAVRHARGDLLVMLNNDTTACDPLWLRIMAAHALQENVGAVGCKLLYPDGTVQHAGVALGLRGGAQHVFVGIEADDPAYNYLATVDRTVSAVTAACLAVRRRAFDAVGGMREDLAVSYNDVVFCADLQAAGYRNVCVAAPLFVHHESRSRGKDTDKAKRARHRAERARAIALHPALFAQDPYYSPHLSRKVDHRLLLA